MNLSDQEFRLYQDLVHRSSGICLRENRKEFLENRVAKRMEATGKNSPYWYYKHITEHDQQELLALLDFLTTNETSFFRNGPQMQLFRNKALPCITAAKEGSFTRKLRIWSAGCATGEEPYTIAMLVMESLHDYLSWDIKIYASDISTRALAVASRGEYGGSKFRESVSDHYRMKYFQQQGDVYQVRDEVRKLVTFDIHNLKNDNGLTDLDVIFCRNVMIYFDLEEQRRLARRFYQVLRPGGFLFIGHAESFQGMNTGFKFIFSHNGTAYCRPEPEDQEGEGS